MRLGLALLAAALLAGAAGAARPPAREILFLGSFRETTALLAIRADGTGLREIASKRTGVSPWSPLWSPDGRLIVVHDGTGLVLLPAAGGAATRLTTGDHGAVGWSPDGRWIAYVHYGARSQGLSIVSADGKTTRFLRAPAGQAAWAPDSKRLVVGVVDHLEIVDVNGRWRGVPNTRCASRGAFSPDGKWIAMTRCRGRDDGVAVVRPDGTGFRWLVRPEVPSASYGPVWAPEGKRLAYTYYRLIGYLEHSEIRMVGLDGRRLGNLDSTEDDHDEYPVWSPDGTQIAFDRDAAIEPIGEADRLAVGDVRTGRVRILYSGTERGTQRWRPGVIAVP